MPRFFWFLSLALFPFMVSAQSSKQQKKTVQRVSKVICDCINQDFKLLDAEVRKSFITAITHPDGIETYIMSLSPALQQRIIEQLPALNNMGENVPRCLDDSKLESEISRLNMDADQLMRAAIEQMAKDKKCKDVGALLRAIEKQ